MLILKSNLANQIKKKRKYLNISTQELASRIKLSTGCINNLENGRHDVFKIDLLNKIIGELNIRIEDIVADVERAKINNVKTSEKNKCEFDIFVEDEFDKKEIKEGIMYIVSAYIDLIKECKEVNNALPVINSLIATQLNNIKEFKKIK